MPSCLPLIAGSCASVLLAILSHAAQAGEHRWAEAAQVGAVIYRADFQLAERDRLLTELERLRSELFATLALPPSAEAIELYLFRDENSYREYLAERYGDLPKRRALYIKAGGPGMVYAFRGEHFTVDLRHETTHALLHTVLDDVPLWLDEGLAEYLEVPVSDRSSADPHFRDLRAQLAVGQLPRLESLETLDDSTGMQREAYLAAWAWVHFLLHGPPVGRDELVAYLADLRIGVEALPLSVRLRRQMPEVERLFESHFRRPPASPTRR